MVDTGFPFGVEDVECPGQVPVDHVSGLAGHVGVSVVDGGFGEQKCF